MIAAFAWGFGAASSLFVGMITLRRHISEKALGLVMAFGAGVLLSAVAFELVEEAFHVAEGGIAVAIGLAAGAVTFYVGDAFIDRAGGEDRKRMHPTTDDSDSPLAIVLGIVLDGIPESIVIGLTLIGGGSIDLAVVIAVFLSNVPESIAATTGLSRRGWTTRGIAGLWLTVSLASGAASAVGFALFANASGSVIGLVDSFAAGAILTMLADTMIPEAFKHGGRQTGLATTLGFGLAFGLSVLP